MSISKFKILLLVMLLCSVTFSQIIEDSRKFEMFRNFTQEFNKTYPNETEKMLRFEIFKKNLALIESLAEADQTASETEKELITGLTEFLDLTAEEFQSTYLNSFNSTNANTSSGIFDPSTDLPITTETDGKFLSNSTSTRNLQSVTVPTSWDWRAQGAVTSVKYQGLCASCWAYSAAANLEGLYFRKYGKLISFSPQQMIDCSTSNKGCGGGNVQVALQYLMDVGGLQLYSSYPPTLTQGTCRFNPALTVVKVQKFVKTDNDEIKIMEMVYLVGPVTVTMNANLLQYYKTGIISATSAQCPPTIINHSVTLVGYGVSATGYPYWIVKNSWGATWGENGYFRILRGYGTCGINTFPVTGVLV